MPKRSWIASFILDGVLPLIGLGLLAMAMLMAFPAKGKTNGRCVSSLHHTVCTTQPQQPSAKIMQRETLLPPLMEEDEIERDRLWMARCKPRLVFDEHGVSRAVYAARGCSYGQWKD